MVTFRTPSLSENLNVEFDIPVIGNSFPTGLSGFIFEYTVSSNLAVMGVTFPAFGLTDHTPPRISAVDLSSLVIPGAVNALVCTFRVKILALGVPSLGLSSIQLDNDAETL